MLYFWSILAYLFLLILVGALRSGKVESGDDFIVAGRSLSAPVLVGTLLATWIGSGSLFGGAGLAYEKGWPALWFDAGVWVAIVVLYFLAGRARALALYTVPDILELRYNRWARLLGALVTVVAYTAIVSYQFRAGGLVLQFVAGVPLERGIALTAAFVIGYTVLAGMLSVAYTDVVNGIVMLAGFLIALPLLWGEIGGWQGLHAALPAERFQVFGELHPLQALGYSFSTLLLLLGEAGMYQRFFSARDERTARNAVLGWVGTTIFIESLIVALAVAASALFTGIDPEKAILYVVRDGLPVWAGCVCLAAVVAVIVSTADSFLLVPSTSLMRDVYQRFIDPQVGRRRFLLYSRLAVVGLGLVAWVQVRYFERVLEMAIYAYTMYGAGLTPALMAAFLWRRATAAGGVGSIAAGMTVTAVWEIAGHPWGVPTVYPALAASLACLVGLSLCTRGRATGKSLDELIVEHRQRSKP